MRHTLWTIPGTLLLALALCACGYTLRGQEASRATGSVLGNGDKTVRLLEVGQPTNYTDLGYILRSQLRDEINARGLAVWKDSGQADYGIIINVDSFTVNAYGQSRSMNLLYTASLTIEFRVVDGRTNQPVWQSGQIGYSDRYANVNEEMVIREMSASIIRRAVDRMQQVFYKSSPPAEDGGQE